MARLRTVAWLASLALGSVTNLGAAAEAPAPAVLGFAQAFDAALAFDAQFRGARYERDSTQAGVPIARAQLLPNVNLSVNDSQTRGVREFPNILNQPVSVQLDYGAPQTSLQMRAPLFNYESLSRYRQALAQSDAADAVYRVRGGELVERLTTAYLQGMVSAENVRQLRAQIDSLQAQLERADQRLARGEGTRIDVADARSQLEVAKAKQLDALDQLVVARKSLARVTGVDAAALRQLPDGFAAQTLDPAQLDDWQNLARMRNPVIQVREKQVEAARRGVDRARAGHLPRLDAVATYSHSSNDSIASLNQTSRLASVGLQLSVPIFAGFGVEAGISQSQSDLAKAETDLANERENVALEVQRNYQTVSSAKSRLEAYAQSVTAAELVLEGVTRGQASGLRTLAEVQDALARLFSARRDLAQSRLDYLLAHTRLQLLSGASLTEVVFEVERLLGGQP